MFEQSTAVARSLSAELRSNAFAQTGLGTELLLQRIVDTCASNLAVLDESGNILYASRAWLLSHDQTLATMTDGLGLKHLRIGLGSGLSLSPEIIPLASDIQRILDHREREFHKEYPFKGLGGPRWYRVHAARLDLPESNGFRVLVTREDITRRREAEEELRNLGGRLIKAQEDERRRIARELHDDLNQRLAILGIELDQLQQLLPAEQTELSDRVDRLSSKAQEISSDIHKLSYRLHPSKLDHLGLAAALKSLCQELSEHQEIEIDFQQDGFPADLPQDITLCVFRIAQESLRNAIKHSGSRTARVVLRKTTQVVHLRVSDTGRGFDYDSPKSSKGLGFISMRERLRLVDGEISIRSQANRGTQIDVLIPLASRDCGAACASSAKITSDE